MRGGVVEEEERNERESEREREVREMGEMEGK